MDGGDVETLLFNEEETEETAKRIHNSVLNLPTFFMYEDVSTYHVGILIISQQRHREFKNIE